MYTYLKSQTIQFEVGENPGGITLTDQCVLMIVPNFAKKGCILKVYSLTQMYVIFFKVSFLMMMYSLFGKKGYIFAVHKNVKS